MADKKKKEVTFTQKDVDEICSAIQKAFDTDKKMHLLLFTTEDKRLLSFRYSVAEVTTQYVTVAENSKNEKVAIQVAGIITR